MVQQQPEYQKGKSVISYTVSARSVASKKISIYLPMCFFLLFLQCKLVGKISRVITSNLKKLGKEGIIHML